MGDWFPSVCSLNKLSFVQFFFWDRDFLDLCYGFVPLPQDFWALDEMSKCHKRADYYVFIPFPLCPSLNYVASLVTRLDVCCEWICHALFLSRLYFLSGLSVSGLYLVSPCVCPVRLHVCRRCGWSTAVYVLWSHVDVSTVTVAISSGLDFHLGLLM